MLVLIFLFILVVLETFHRWRGGKRANKVMMRLCSFHNGHQILFSKPLASKMIAGLFSTSVEEILNVNDTGKKKIQGKEANTLCCPETFRFLFTPILTTKSRLASKGTELR